MIPDCRAAIFFHLAGPNFKLLCHNFLRGRRDTSIAAPQFFQLAGAIPLIAI